jgi:WXG100 family type VII secretion target
MANYFKYDADKFRAAINAYEKAINEFRKLQSDTAASIEALKNEGWNSEAGKEFFNNYTDDWSPILNDYVDLLEYLKKCLQQGESLFNPIVSEAETIKIQ